MTQTRSVSEVFTDLIVAFLAPMFLCVTNGDIAHARAAAIETVNAYRGQNQVDLLSIAQIIAFGLAALGSLSLATADSLSLSMTLRLRANAVASNRAGEQCRRALGKSQESAPPAPEELVAQDDPFPEDAAIAAGVNRVREQAAAAKARLETPQPTAPQPAAPKPTAPKSADQHPQPRTETAAEDLERRTLWASAMADVAAEVTASMPHLPPKERRAASIRAAALSSAASDLLAGKQGQLPPMFNFHLPAKSA